jgi:hypothetical protein
MVAMATTTQLKIPMFSSLFMGFNKMIIIIIRYPKLRFTGNRPNQQKVVRLKLVSVFSVAGIFVINTYFLRYNYMLREFTMKIMMQFQPDILTEMVSGGRLTHYSLSCRPGIQNRRKGPLPKNLQTTKP